MSRSVPWPSRGSPGPRPFGLREHDHNSSLLPPRSESQEAIGGGWDVVREIEVPTATLDELGGEQSIDVLKLDVQGAELDVIGGGRRALDRTRAVLLEMNLFSQYEGDATFDVLHAEMRGLGFELVNLMAPVTTADGTPPFVDGCYARGKCILDTDLIDDPVQRIGQPPLSPQADRAARPRHRDTAPVGTSSRLGPQDGEPCPSCPPPAARATWRQPPLPTGAARHRPSIGRAPRGGRFLRGGSANDGYQQSNTYYLERFCGWRGILIEPIPELYTEAVVEQPNSQVINAALVSPEQAGGTVRMRFGGLCPSSRTAEDPRTRISTIWRAGSC